MRVNFNSVPAATFGKRLSDENVKVIAEPGGFSEYLLKGAAFFFFLKNYFANWFRVLKGSKVCVAIYDFRCIMVLGSKRFLKNSDFTISVLKRIFEHSTTYRKSEQQKIKHNDG